MASSQLVVEESEVVGGLKNEHSHWGKSTIKESYGLQVSHTVGTIVFSDVMGSDLTVVNAARVSLDKQHDLFLAGTDDKLIRYLATHQHITPFFHPQIRLRITMPIYLLRQWQRSTVGFARNEMSRRYVSSSPLVFVPDIIRTAPSQYVKQGSGAEHLISKYLQEFMVNHVTQALFVYDKLIELGVCPEQARGVLPQSTYTEVIETGSLYAYARLYNLRHDHHAQKEIRDLAALLDPIMVEHFPVSWPALTSKTWP